VRKLGKGFRWEYVAIFRIARARNRFEVVAEYDATSASLTVGEQYTQGLDEGMLGATRQKERTLRVGDVRPPTPQLPDWKPPCGYIRTREAQVSAMCVPVRLGGEVEWILDCESSQVDAFHQPDQDVIEAIVAEVEKTVALWFESRLNHALLDSMSQGVVVVDEQHRIERANSAARYLLGCATADPVGCDLPSLGANPSDRELLSGAGAQGTAGVHLDLVGPDGQRRSVLALSREPPTTFNRRIWLLSDPSEQQWIAGLAHFRATVQSVAAQARGPLLLANALVRRAQRLLPDGATGAVAGLLERAARSLSKTDITYERLTATLAMQSEAIREGERVPFSLAAGLQSIAASLPEEDVKALRLEIPDELPLLRADPERLRFALRSAVGHLLCIRGPDGEVALRARDGDGRVDVELELTDSPESVEEPAPPPREGDVIRELEQEARATVELASSAIKAVVEAHDGRFLREVTSDGIRIRLLGLETAPAWEEAGR
jgi:PAS domain-containing protein